MSQPFFFQLHIFFKEFIFVQYLVCFGCIRLEQKEKEKRIDSKLLKQNVLGCFEASSDFHSVCTLAVISLFERGEREYFFLETCLRVATAQYKYFEVRCPG